MDGNLINNIQDLTQQLNNSIKMLSRYGQDLAMAERDYKILLAQEALKLRSEKEIPVTLIQQTVYGIESVARKRYKRDVAETMYNVAQENINSIKLQLRIMENQIQREWTNSGKGL